MPDLGMNLLGCSGRLTTLAILVLKFVWPNNPYQIDRQQQLLLKIIADVFPPINTHLNAPEQQTDKTWTFIEVLILADDQLIKCVWTAAAGNYFLS